MTREEAIKHLELFAKLRKELTVGGQETNDALDLALTAQGAGGEGVEGALERIDTFGRVCILLSLWLQRFGSKQLYLLP